MTKNNTWNIKRVKIVLMYILMYREELKTY